MFLILDGLDKQSTDIDNRTFIPNDSSTIVQQFRNMQSILTKLASVTVMLHMALGCSWHHGIGVNACSSECASHAVDPIVKWEHHDCDGSQHTHGHSDDQHHQQPVSKSESTSDNNASDEGHKHSGCQNDGCKIVQVVKFEFSVADFSAEYLSGAENSAIAYSQTFQGFDSNQIDQSAYPETGVRGHLLLGVQLL